MEFTEKRSLQEGEEVLYTPNLHWMFPVRHIVLLLPFFLLLFILWENIDSYTASLGQDFLLENALAIKGIIGKVFPAAFIVTALVFVCRIFLFICIEYAVTNKRLIIKKGFFRVIIAEIPGDRIESIYCVQGILGRIFSYGTVSVSGVSGTKQVFYMVSQPYAFRRAIIDMIEGKKAVTAAKAPLARPKPIAEKGPTDRSGTFIKAVPNDV